MRSAARTARFKIRVHYLAPRPFDSCSQFTSQLSVTSHFVLLVALFLFSARVCAFQKHTAAPHGVSRGQTASSSVGFELLRRPLSARELEQKNATRRTQLRGLKQNRSFLFNCSKSHSSLRIISPLHYFFSFCLATLKPCARGAMPRRVREHEPRRKTVRGRDARWRQQRRLWPTRRMRPSEHLNDSAYIVVVAVSVAPHVNVTT